jgi:hypothetical protein
VGIIWMKIWPASTPKNPKARIVRGNPKEFVDGSVIGKEFGGGVVSEVDGDKESLIPVF